MRNPFLVADHVYLRVLTQDDLNAIYREWFNDEDVCRYNSHHRFPNYDENMQDYFERVIKSRENLILAICDKDTDKHIGNIALENIDLVNRSAEFAILIGDKLFWGNGIGKEASALIIDHGFKELGLHRIYCGTSEKNVAMQKLASKLGFIEEGRARGALFKNGDFTNIIQYGLLGDEFKR